MGLKADIDFFVNDEDLYKTIKPGTYDLIFISIEPPVINGVEIGRYIRENLKCEDVQIVYISKDDGCAMELFDSHPLNFLIKPVDNSKIRKVIINMCAGNDEYYGIMDKIYEKLDKREFLYIHKSFIVNCRYIKEIRYDYVIMFNGRRLPISKKRRKNIHDTYKKMK